VSADFVARGQDLELESIRKGFPGFVAVDDLDLKIPAGEFFALLGPSGCGKTTTLRMIAGLETPSAGRILIGGNDVTDQKPHQRPVNTVFQNYALFPHMSVEENVAFGLKQRKVDNPQQRAQAALEMVELQHLAARRPQQLSGGQQQRVALARALVNRPALLLLDEPSAGLSPVRQDEAFLRVSDINKAGVTCIMVEQNARRCLQISDRAYVLDQGKDAVVGTGRELLNDPQVIGLYLGTLGT